MHTVLYRGLWLACLLTLSVALSSRAEASLQEPPPKLVEAVWKSQSIVFVYRSEGRLYPCGHLAEKIAAILQRLGAGARTVLRAERCRDFASLATFEAQIVSPVEATAENIIDITTYDAQEELIARMQGVELPTASTIPRFTAIWKPVSFRKDSALNLDSGDCALLRQLRNQVIPTMSVRIENDMRGGCSTGTDSFAPKLTVTALVPAIDREF